MIPQYNTVLFSNIYPDVDKFKEDYQNIGLPATISIAHATTLFYLLYAHYGNSPIVNMDEEQWKYRLYSIIYMYGPTWEKKTELQSKLRALSDEDLTKGSTTIFNHALNPSTEPSTDTERQLAYINDQNVQKAKRSQIDAYSLLWGMLSSNVDKEFIDKFATLFKKIVAPENPLLYGTEEE